MNLLKMACFMPQADNIQDISKGVKEMEKLQDEQGSMILETTLVLPIVIFAFLFINFLLLLDLELFCYSF